MVAIFNLVFVSIDQHFSDLSSAFTTFSHLDQNGLLNWTPIPLFDVGSEVVNVPFSALPIGPQLLSAMHL